MVVIAHVVLLRLVRRRRGRIVHHRVPVRHVAIRRHLVVHITVRGSRCRRRRRCRRLLRGQTRPGRAATPHPAALVRLTTAQQRAHAERVLFLRLRQRLRLPTRPVLVVRVLLHMHRPQPFRLVDERALLLLGQVLPLRAEPLRDFRVVHLRIVGRHLSPLAARPHHERVHRTLYAVRVLLGRLARVVVVVVHPQQPPAMMVMMVMQTAPSAGRDVMLAGTTGRSEPRRRAVLRVSTH
uniref:Uncharacterized protein n=1 Tax=Anopheles atroparvus TaxID=41427 RepID=A0AAG5DDD9_ANOAO